MYKSYLSLIFLCLFLTSCNKEINPFQISKQNIGQLTDSTQVKDLEAIYIQDSLVKDHPENEFNMALNDIEIFDKEGHKLLNISPRKPLDSMSYIQSVQIFDSRFKTDKNLSILSTFKDINSNYKITRIDNLINTIVVTVNEINASFTIDKKELPANMRFDRTLKIEPIHIPDNAKIKFFFINWNQQD